jgi:predicted TIM-barrel fold metal-dependent hydrolase
MTATDPSSRVVIVSSDGHAGAALHEYKPYLEQRWHPEFDEWAASFVDPWADLQDSEIAAGVVSASSRYNWESANRLHAVESDGVVAEVLFPNTAPPFLPGNVLACHVPLTRDEYVRRMAGLRAHNRWLADFCAAAPGRRAGIGQILLNDVDDALAEIRWIKDAGLRGVLLPASAPRARVDLYYPRYEPIWELCAELDVPVHVHATLPADPISDEHGIAGPTIGQIEGPFYSRRGFSHLVFAGVFDRVPGLKFVFTETRSGWIPGYLAELDGYVRAATTPGTVASILGGRAARAIRRLPSEYFESNCFLGASLITRGECDARYEVGVDKIMYGSDFPHSEGTYPYTREAIRLVFETVPDDELLDMLAANAARLYDLDMSLLQGHADRVGPTLADLRRPLRADELPKDSASPTFGAQAGFQK